MTHKFAAALAIAASSLLGTVVLSSAASASVVLFDDFNADAQILNWSGDGVFTSDSIGGAATDLIGTGFFDFQPGNGNYVDLDGSTGGGHDPAGQLTSIISFGAGAYTLTFDLAGNLRGAPAATTEVYLGTQLIASINRLSSDVFALFSFSFTSATGGNLIFTERGPSNNQGNLLDNVTLATRTVDAVPEPSTWALLLMGLGALAMAFRRRAQA